MMTENLRDKVKATRDRVPTTELETGELVVCHGMVFRLRDRNERDGVVWFTTDPYGFWWAADNPSSNQIPLHWRDEWTVQGNESATWGVVEF